MKAKTKQRTTKAAEPQKSTPAPPAQPMTVSLPAPRPATPEEMEMFAPPPEQLEHEAEAEPNRRFLRDYLEVIRTLRGKGFSFREIAEWLGERGVVADHNAVYRVFTNYMTADDAQQENELDQEDAEAQANHC
jgi:hypothetical protein